jgi:hypothetical protein
MAKQLAQAWKTPDGRYFDIKEDARIYMQVENTKDDLAKVHGAFAPIATPLCMYASDVIRILTDYQESVQPSAAITEIAATDTLEAE